MMKSYILIITLFFGIFSAQTHRFIYEYKYKPNASLDNYKDANMVLDINPETVKFYDYQYITIDSANITKGQNSQLWVTTSPAVTRARNSYNNTNYIYADRVFSTKTVDKMNWNLQKETKKLGRYTLQKATTQFGGRSWTAWFTKEIPISEGPYKFRGLPGMIFHIYDDQANFEFKLVKSYKLKSTYRTPFLERFYGKAPLEITEKNLQKILLQQYNDPYQETMQEFKNNTNPKTQFSINGTTITDISQFRDLTLSRQKHLRENNNPIEIDKAVNYPDK